MYVLNKLFGFPPNIQNGDTPNMKQNWKYVLLFILHFSDGILELFSHEIKFCLQAG
jgi:hypothetical protein